MSELLAELTGIYDFLDNQRVIIKHDYEASVKTLEDLKKQVKEQLAHRIKGIT